MLYQDLPIVNKEQDILGRARFATELAASISKSELSAGFAIGLYGEWGSGKTSVLNMVEEAIREQDGDSVIVRFNPWLCSNAMQMIEQFFILLSEEIETVTNIKDKITKYSKKYLQLVNLVPLLSSIPGISQINATLKTFIDVLSDEKSIQKQKDELIDALKYEERRIIVIIDDIDRLSSDEIVAVFQLIRSLADFPNTIYLLAFDRDIVVKSLEKVQNGSGADYLEKIIQYPIAIPVAKEDKVNEILLEKLNKVITTPFYSNSEEKYRCHKLFYDGIFPIIQSVRNAVRFSNTLSLKYGLLKDEVNIIDLIGITCLQVFVPKVYDNLSAYKDYLCASMSIKNIAQSVKGKQAIKDRIKDVKEIILNFEDTDTFDKRKNIESIIYLLFPPINENPYGLYGDIRNSLIDKRICNEYYFDMYFSLSLESHTIQSAILNELFETADESRISEILIDISNKQKLEILFKYINQHFEQKRALQGITERAAMLFNQIFKNFAQITKNYQEYSLFELGFGKASVIYGSRVLLQCVSENEKVILVISVIGNNKLPLFVAVDMLIIFEQENGRLTSYGYSRNDRLFNEEQLAYIEEAFYQRVNTMIDETIWEEQCLLQTLHILSELNNNDLHLKLSNFIANEIKKDDYKLLDWICHSCVGKGNASSMNDSWVCWSVNRSVENLFISYDEAYNRLMAYIKTPNFLDLTNNLKFSVVAFILDYEFHSEIADKSQVEIYGIRKKYFNSDSENDRIKEDAIRRKISELQIQSEKADAVLDNDV